MPVPDLLLPAAEELLEAPLQVNPSETTEVGACGWPEVRSVAHRVTKCCTETPRVRVGSLSFGGLSGLLPNFKQVQSTRLKLD